MCAVVAAGVEAAGTGRVGELEEAMAAIVKQLIDKVK